MEVRRHWIWFLGFFMGFWIVLLIVVGVSMGSRPAAGTEDLTNQLQVLVGVAQVFLAFVVAVATLYHVRRNSEMVDLMRNQDQDDIAKERRARVDALIGASFEVAGYAGWMAESQRSGLKTWRKWVPEPIAQREILVVCWRQLSASTISVSKALERIRFEDGDLAELAGHHFDLVLELQQSAAQGDVDHIEVQVAEIRRSADALWAELESGRAPRR